MATPSLFGMLGDEAAMQRQLDEQRAQAFAAQTQEQRLAGMGYQAGAGLGRTVAGMFGADTTDPVVRKASQVRQLASQFDTTQPEGMMKFAQAVQAIDPNLAVQAAQQAASMSKGLADVNKIKAETEAKIQETSGKQARVSTLVSSGLSQKEAEGIASSDTAFSNYVKAKKVETPVDYATQAQKLGFSAKPFLADYTPDQIKAMESGVQQNKVSVAQAGRPTTINQQESAFAKQRGEMQAKALADTEAQAKTSASALERLKTMESKNKGDMLTGPLAGTAIGAGQFLSSLGLLSPQSAGTLSNSEVYDKSAKDLVMQDLGGKLGGQVSDSDRNYIEARIPQLKNSQQARTELIAKLQEIHQKNIRYYQSMSQHANKYNNLNNFDFAQNAPSSAQPTLGTKENPIKLP